MKTAMATLLIGLGLAMVLASGCLTDPDDVVLGQDESELGTPPEGCEPVPVPPSACGDGQPIPLHEATCDDGKDNDCDGLVDYCDPDCYKWGGCWGCNNPTP